MIDLKTSGATVLAGPTGVIECLIDLPDQAPTGVALIAHPQPLRGGTAQHKVPQWLARTVTQAGWITVRPNFRGVGRSTGTHDAGIGETEDLLWLCTQLRTALPQRRLALLGFSFGAFVQARVARALAARAAPAWRVVLAGMPCGEAGGRRYDTPDGIADALVVHGERDESVPLAAILDWARPTMQPVVVIPGADHAFSGKLHLLRAQVLWHLAERPGEA